MMGHGHDEHSVGLDAVDNVVREAMHAKLSIGGTERSPAPNQ
jgi:hypothetical protein